MNDTSTSVRWNAVAVSVGVGILVLVAIVLIAGLIGPLADWTGGQFAQLGALEPAVKVTLLQTFLAVVGGLWAFYLYRSSRANQTTISIAPTCWLAESRVDDFLVFNVRTRVTNVSKAVCRNCQATVTLMDASERDAATGQMSMPTFAEQDPWANLYPDPSRDFPISLEPGESIDCETAFLLSRRPLLGVRISVEGDQGLFRSPFEWNSFFLVDVLALKPTSFGLVTPTAATP
jgi:hypothetical protein